MQGCHSFATRCCRALCSAIDWSSAASAAVFACLVGVWSGNVVRHLVGKCRSTVSYEFPPPEDLPPLRPVPPVRFAVFDASLTLERAFVARTRPPRLDVVRSPTSAI